MESGRAAVDTQLQIPFWVTAHVHSVTPRYLKVLLSQRPPQFMGEVQCYICCAVGCPGWIEIPHKGVSSTVSFTCFHKFVLFMCNKTRRTTVSYKINLPLKDLWFLFSVPAGSSHNSNLFVLLLFILHPFQQFHHTCAHNIHGIHGRLGFPWPWLLARISTIRPRPCWCAMPSTEVTSLPWRRWWKLCEADSAGWNLRGTALTAGCNPEPTVGGGIIQHSLKKIA